MQTGVGHSQVLDQVGRSLGSPAKVGGKYQKYYLCKKKAMQDSQMLLEVVRLILPEEFLTYFKITKVTKVKDVITGQSVFLGI